MDFRSVLLAIFQARIQETVIQGDERGSSPRKRARARHVDKGVEDNSRKVRAY